MRTPRLLHRLVAFFGAWMVLFAAFLLIARPWYRTWGATAQELQRPLPGDFIIPGDASQETRAITINAPADLVWPWVAQLGQYRGGFYSFDQLENAVGCEMPTTDVLTPAHQIWQVGDTLWMYGRTKAGGAGFAILQHFVHERALAFSTTAVGSPKGQIDGSWSFAIEPIDSATTRLLIRGRLTRERSLVATAFDVLMFEPMHFAMERRTMLGIKEVVEQGARDRAENTAQIVLWIATFTVFVVAGVGIFRRSRFEDALATFVTAGVVFQVLTLGQPSPILGTILVALLSLGYWGMPRLRPVPLVFPRSPHTPPPGPIAHGRGL